MKREMTRISNGRCFSSLVVLLSLAVGVLPASLFAQENQIWTWSPKQVYHEATVKIEQHPFEGSGVLVAINKSGTQGFVLTANHLVMSDSVVVTEWRDGYKSQGKVIARDKDRDLAVVTCDPPDKVVVASIAKELPPGGEVCDHTGWGTNKGILRRYLGRFMHDEDGYNYTGTAAVDGDSGGGVWYNGKLVGIISGGRYTAATIGDNSDKWNVSYPLRSTSLDAIQDICDNCVPDKPEMGDAVAFGEEIPPNYFEYLGEKQKVEPEDVKVNLDVEIDRRDPVRVPAKTQIQVQTPQQQIPVVQPQIPIQAQVQAKAPAPIQPPPQQIVVNVDTASIADKVVKHIIGNDLLPRPKVDTSVIIIQVAERLRDDEIFAQLVADKLSKTVEKKIMDRIGKSILGK